jgi:hypothetical protein
MKISIDKLGITSFIVVLCLLALSTGAFAQGKSNKKNAERLIGTWAMDYNKSIGQIKAKSKSHFDTLKQEKKNRVKNSFSSRKITFQKDGGYILELRPGQQVNGTWELQSDDATLLISLEDKQFEQRIENISTSTMILNLGGDQDRNRLFRKWHLKKITK